VKNKILCFIPARKNSKGIKNKNLRILNGKPLIYYTLKYAIDLKKKLNLHIHLSSDDKKILDYAQKTFDIKNDYERPEKISRDNSKMITTALHTINWYKKKKIFFDDLLLLQPTNPVRKKNELVDAINVYKKKKLISLMSVNKTREHPSEIINIKKKQWSYLEKPPQNSHGRQSFKNNFFFVDGNIYLAKTKFLEKYGKFVIKNKTFPFLINRTWPIDIDDSDDILIAEIFLKKYNLG